ncbi:MAG: hypothetical protein HY000_07230 [Planctomycetes bacterium]|nr:hypothetical protein [Planctomycetota bacterium]
MIDSKRWTTGVGGEKVELPERSAVLRFCRGNKTDESTWGPLCGELGLPFSLLEKGHSLSESELDDAEFKRHWSFCHRASYSGQVWIQVVAKFENRAVPHHYTIRWGPWKYSSVLTFERLESATLIHMKGDDGLSVPIIVDVSLPCYVAFGREDPPGALTHDINHGWTYVDGAASEQPQNQS